jgi:nucleoid DNA-binding protein
VHHARGLERARPRAYKPTVLGAAMSGENVPKRTIADRIAAETGLRQVDVLAVVQRFLGELGKELVAGNRLEFRDFGVFEQVQRRPRMALNPRTLERIAVPARRTIKFRPSANLRRRIDAHDAGEPADTDAPPPA